MEHHSGLTLLLPKFFRLSRGQLSNMSTFMQKVQHIVESCVTCYHYSLQGLSGSQQSVDIPIERVISIVYQPSLSKQPLVA